MASNESSGLSGADAAAYALQGKLLELACASHYMRLAELPPVHQKERRQLVLAFWREVLDDFTWKAQRVQLPSVDVLKKVFTVDGGVSPVCLEEVIAVLEGVERVKSSNSGTSWTTALWGVVGSWIGAQSQDFVIWKPALERAAERIWNTLQQNLHARIDTIVLLDEARTMLQENLSDSDLSLVFEHLQLSGKVTLFSTDREERVMKIHTRGSSRKVESPDKAIAEIKSGLRVAHRTSELYHAQAVECREKAKLMLHANKKAAAARHLKMAKLYESKSHQKLDVACNLERMLHEFDRVESTAQVAASMREAAAVLKSDEVLKLDDVDDMMQDLAASLDESQAVDEIMAQPLALADDIDNSDLESLLTELELEDAPSVPSIVEDRMRDRKFNADVLPEASQGAARQQQKTKEIHNSRAMAYV